MVDVRMNNDGRQSQGTGPMNATPCHGELIIGGGTAFASGSNPTAEVIDGTGVVAGRSYGVTLDTATGTLVPLESGDFDIELNLADFSSGAASGNVQFDVQVDGAALASTNRMQAIRVAATAKAGLILKKRIALVKGQAVRAVVTSAAGLVQTITEGSLSIRQVSTLSTKAAPV